MGLFDTLLAMNSIGAGLPTTADLPGPQITPSGAPDLGQATASQTPLVAPQKAASKSKGPLGALSSIMANPAPATPGPSGASGSGSQTYAPQLYGNNVAFPELQAFLQLRRAMMNGNLGLGGNSY